MAQIATSTPIHGLRERRTTRLSSVPDRRSRPAAVILDGGSVVGDAVGPYRIEARPRRGRDGPGLPRRTRADRLPRRRSKLLRPELAATRDRIRRLLREAPRGAHGRAPPPRRAAARRRRGGRPALLALELVPGMVGVGRSPRRRGSAPTRRRSPAHRRRGGRRARLRCTARGSCTATSKPSNVLLDARRAARLTDFGLAKGRRLPALTLPGQMLGTMDYLAPELIRGEEPSAASGLYAFGCLVYACVAGRPPFAAAGACSASASAHLDEEPPDPCAPARRRAGGLRATPSASRCARRRPTRPSTATAYARLIAVGARGGSG